MFLLISIKEPTKLNMDVFKNTMYSRFTYSAVILDMNCKGTMEILKLVTNKNISLYNYNVYYLYREINNNLFSYKL